jgi:glycine/serine hydroxymethyltransferase
VSGGTDNHLFLLDLSDKQMTGKDEVAGWIADIIDAGGAADTVARVRNDVAALCRRFPVYGK